MGRGDLYFMCNPALGIIKIGITQDVESRRRSLECAAGVPIEILKIVEGGSHYEEPLHLSLAPSRLLGEWFAPEPNIMGLISGKESIPAFLERMAPAVDERARLAEAKAAELREVLEAERAADKIARAKVRAEAKRIKAEAAARSEKRRKAREIKERAAAEEAKRLWAEKHPSIVARVTDNTLAQQAAERRATLLAHQRGRNAAMIGLEPVLS